MTDLATLALRRHARRLLAPWDRPDSAGMTLGLVRDGALLVHESAGAASLELGVPIGPETCFRIASVSKQFTCAAILLLAADGRLSVGDPIHRHLPDLPEFGVPVTIDHLMRNCSGIRDMLELMRLGGVDLSMLCRAEDLLAAIGRQRSLNFPPGSRFLYSNAGFLLLGRIVEAVAGEPLAEHLARRILAPLGMTATRHTPSLAEVVPNLATGYMPRPEGGFARAQHGFPLGGEGGLVSSVEDLALWDRNLSTGLVGGPALAAALTERAPFLNGTLNRYARGLEVTGYRGLRTVDHGGLWPGFRTCFLRVPDHGVTILAIANHGGADPHAVAHRMLDAALEGSPLLHPVPALPPRPALAPLAGRWVAADGAAIDIALDAEGTPMATTHGLPFALAAGDDGRLVARRGIFPFALRLPEDGVLEIETDAGTVTRYRPAPPGATLPEGLAGRWACEELGATWSIGPEGVRVQGPLASAGPWAIEPIAADAFRIRTPGTLFQGWLDCAAERDAAGALAGFAVHGARARGLRFHPA